MTYTYKTKGVCSSKIQFDLNDDIVSNVKFTGGCPGNLAAIQILVEGANANDIIKKLDGVKCGMKSTSCSDQLVRALKESKM